MNQFVRLKHYAVFLLIFVAPYSIFFIFIALLRTIDIPPILRSIAPISLVIPITGWFVWIYSIGTLLYEKLPDTQKMSVTRFKWFLIIPCLFLVCLIILTLTYNRNANSLADPIRTIIMFFIAVLYFFSIFCVFYVFYFVSKCLKATERQQPVLFKNYVILYLLFLFLPIGIWIIQPRINKIFSEDNYELGADIVVKE